MKRAGFVVIGKSEHAGVRDHRRHGVRAERRVPEPVGHLAHARRLVGRRRGGGRRGRAAARARLGRRRLGPHPRRLLRPLRDQAVARARLCRPVRQRLAGAVAERAALGHRPRRGRVPRRDRGLRAGRRALGAATGAARSSRRSAPTRAGCGSRSRPSPPMPHPVDPRLVDVARRAADALAALGHDVVERDAAVGRRVGAVARSRSSGS